MQALKLIYSYLSNRFQSVRVKDTYSSANKVKSGVPQGSLLGVTLFNIQFNDIFDIIDQAELYNYADDNNLSAVGQSITEAKNILKQQTTAVLEWFDQNHLIANTEKFHLMFLSTDKTDQLVNEQLFIGDKTSNNEPCITLLGMDIDNLLTFNKHIANLCKKVASQLNVLTFKIYGPHREKTYHASVYSLEFRLLCTDMAFLQRIKYCKNRKNTGESIKTGS